MNAGRTLARRTATLLLSTLLLQLLLAAFPAATFAANGQQDTPPIVDPTDHALPTPEAPPAWPEAPAASRLTYTPVLEPLPEVQTLALPAVDDVTGEAVQGAAAHEPMAPEADKRGVSAGSALIQVSNLPVQVGDLTIRAASVAGSGTGAARPIQAVVLPPAAATLSPVGLAFTLEEPAAAEGVAASEGATQPLQVTIDYSQIPLRFGGSMAERLTLYRVHPCPAPSPAEAAATASAEPCLAWEPLPGANDLLRQQLTVIVTPTRFAAAATPGEESAGIPAEPPAADALPFAQFVPLAMGGDFAAGENAAATTLPGEDLFVLAASASSPQGSYTATPFANVGDHQVALASGAFQTSYPLPLPPAAAGGAPALALGYDSGSVDGMNVNKNNQPGWVGIGWSLESGYIARHLKTCALSQAPGDLCLVGGSNSTDDAYSIVLNGVASRLVLISGNLYRLQHDPTWKVEKFSDGGAAHPDAQQEYWLVTTPDGVRYRFGGEFQPANEGGLDQNSVFTTTIYSYHEGVCGNFLYDLCSKAWRWNLDRIEDPNGNVASYFYEVESNHYAARNDTTSTFRKAYIRAGQLVRIEYGRRAGVNATPPARVLFALEERCEGACAWPANYPDTPGDLTCAFAGTCYENAPTFWSRKRLNYIESQIYNTATGTWTAVARFDLAYTFPTPPNDDEGDSSERKLWLASVTQQTGDGSSGLSPALYGYTWLDNRADAGVAAVSPLKMPRIGQVTTQLGGVVSLSYFQSHPCNINNTSNIHRSDDCGVSFYANGGGGVGYFNRWKVQQLSSADTFSGNATQTTNYAYSTPAWHYADDPALPAGVHLWNDFRGSEVVTVTASSGAMTVQRFHRGMNGDRLNTAGGSYSAVVTLSDGVTRTDDNWLAGQPVEVRRLRSNGSALVRTVNWFVATLTAGSGVSGAYWVGLQKSEETIYGTVNSTSRSEYLYDAYGNRVRDLLYGDITTGADDRTLQRSYLANTTLWLVNRPHWEKLWSGLAPGVGGQEKSFLEFAYDGLAYGAAPTKGNATKERRYWQMTPTAQAAETTTGYDALGRPVSVLDPRSKSSTLQYHPFYGYQTALTRTVSSATHVTTYVVDPGWGVPTRITDPNGKVTDLAYDGFGRLTQVWLPGSAKASDPANLVYVYNVAARPAWVQSRTLRVKSGSVYLDQWRYVDGFGRAVQSQSPAATSGQRLLSSVQYDSLGQTLHQSAPYSASGAAGSGYSAPVWSTVPNYHRFTYDELGALTLDETKSLAGVLWSTSQVQDGRQVRSYDANGRRRDANYTAFGQVASVVEYTVGNVANTTGYTYDLQGNLTQVSDPLGAATTMGYDLLGRKLTMSDPDMGAWQYQYDAAGNLTAQRDGRGLWLYLGYDDLNRLVSKRRDSAGGPLLAGFSYDAAGYKGWLSQSRSYDAAGTTVQITVTQSSYDTRYRVTSQLWSVAGSGSYRVDRTWNEADQPVTLTYPGGSGGQTGEVVSYGYNVTGQLTNVVGSAVTRYISAAGYNAQGQMTQLVNEQGNGANGLTRQWVYESNSLRLNTQRAGKTSPSFVDLQQSVYTYDNAGNLTNQVDWSNSGQKQCYQYDWLDRLTGAYTTSSGNNCTAYSATGSGPYSHSYGYNITGNLTSYAGSAYSYGDPLHKHAVTAAFGNSYGYDANGNQTSRTIGGVAYTLTYDRENRLTAIAGTGTSAGFVYDAEGNRVKSTVNGVTTLYIAGIYEQQGTATTLYYEGNGLRRTGYAADNGVFYRLTDHLGSSSTLVTQAAVASGARNYYYPYGGNRGGAAFNGLTTKRYTGQYHEAALPGGEGLSDYGARWYDAKLGRFLSADTVVPDPGRAIGYNRYAYVNGNPARFTDPSGHAPIVGHCMCGGYVGVNDYMRTENLRSGLNLAGMLPYADTGEDLSVFITGRTYAGQMGLEEPVGMGGRIIAGAGLVLPFGYRSITSLKRFLSSGISANVENAFAAALKEGDVIGLRTRPILSYVTQNFVSDAKAAADVAGPGVKEAFLGIDFGIRWQGGNRVVSDVDIAYIQRNGSFLSPDEVRKVQNSFNVTYGKDLVTHGDLWNGVIAGAGGITEETLQSPTYTYNVQNGVLEFLFRDSYLNSVNRIAP